MSANSLTGRVAIVTGGASAIGRAIALRLADDGAAVVVADLREDPREGGQPTHELIRERGGVAEFVRTNVSDAAELAAMVDAAAIVLPNRTFRRLTELLFRADLSPVSRLDISHSLT